MKTKVPIKFILFVIITVLFISCSKDDGNSSEGLAEIAGNWTATKATFNGINVIENGGEVTLNIQENGRFTFTIQRPNISDLVFTGKLWFDEEWLAVEYDTDKGEVEYYDISYDANNLHLGANSEFDFDGNGSDEIVIFFLDMIR
jgi:hypothetical protein